MIARAHRGLTCVVFFFLSLTGALMGEARPADPILPRSKVDSPPLLATGKTIQVHGGDDLQAAYDSASCGDMLVLEAGATWNGSFVFNKQCTSASWIRIVSSELAHIPIPQHGTAAEANSNAPAPPPNTALYAKICATRASTIPLVTASAASVPAKYHYFAGLEVTSTASQYMLVSVTNNLNENVASQLCDHIWFDRMYVHGAPASASVQMIRGFLLTGSHIAVVNSYVSDIYSNFDAQAIMGATGPGPYKIDNNYLSASTEIVMFGGTGAPVSYSCTVAASPAPTTTSAKVSSCIDAAGGSVSPPAAGTWIMVTTVTAGSYTPDDWVQVATSAAGALTFNATTATPLAGAAHVQWGMVPADIEITHNYFYKPTTWLPTNPAWDGVGRSSKNFIEVKYGLRWLIEGNVMVNSWDGGQPTAFNFNSNDQYGGCPWCVSSDVTLRNNIVKGIGGVLTIIAAQSYAGPAPGPLKRVLLQNNLFWPSSTTPYITGEGRLIVWAGWITAGGGGVDSFQLIHNTFLGAGSNILMGDNTPKPYPNLVIRDNLTEFDQYRWANTCATYPDGVKCIASTLNTDFTYSIDHNAIINTGQVNGDQGVRNATLTSRYGSMILTCCTNSYAETGFVNINAIDTDYHNYALTSGSRYHGLASDGTDPGVNFTTLDAALVPRPAVTAVLNAASLQSDPVAPGEVVAIMGSALGLEAGIAYDGGPDSTEQGFALAGTEVRFDGFPAPVFIASATQVTAVVPLEIAGQAQAMMQVVYKEAASERIPVPVREASPGVFTLDNSGTGQAVAINQDNTLNGAGNGAAQGSTIVTYFTGGGATAGGESVTRRFNGPEAAPLSQPVSVTVGGTPAEVLFAGPAPLSPTGILQLGFRLGPGTPSGDSDPIVVTVGPISSAGTATLAVQ